MSRPSSPRLPNGTGATHQQQQSFPRPSVDEPHDLPYLRPEGQRPSGPLSAPPTSTPSQLPSRSAALPARASTLGSPVTEHHKLEIPPRGTQSASGHSPSDDIAPPNPGWLGSSSRSGSSDEHGLLTPRSPNPSSTVSGHSSSTSATGSQLCSSCGLPMTGQFVRALGSVFHLDCFRCKDCNDVVASKFFPIEGTDGKQYPLCERDYFTRLNLICGKCDQALRGSYITACNKKYHVEHFTCSVCTTLFGPQDSYYEHENDVYCHFHYSTRFATKCVGCSSAILKQFVEINRNSRDECWHPECYMIHKFWNIKVVSRNSMTEELLAPDAPYYDAEERTETAASLKEKQQKMEQQVYRIWTHLSAFEESSAACISDMLRHVSNGNYLDAIRMAEKFILHVEVLFAAIDDLEAHFAQAHSKGMAHVREARMLCRKTVDLFTLLSHTGESGTTRRMGMTQELLSLVTGLAHYLKILIRIALTGALKLDRDHGRHKALLDFLDKLQGLAVSGGNPSARRILNTSRPKEIDAGNAGSLGLSSPSGTEGVTYGYKSLAPENAGESPFVGRTVGPNGTNGAMSTPPSDLCLACQKTVEEDCVRLGTYNRWHSHCVKCVTCGRMAADPIVKEKNPSGNSSADPDSKPTPIVRRAPAKADEFQFQTDATGDDVERFPPKAICCIDHPLAGSRPGFSPVSRLEQFAFLLNVALRRLYLLLFRRGVMPLATSIPRTENPTPAPGSAAYRDSNGIMRMKTVHLDRKLSATARLPKRSTIVESPSGKIAQPTDVQHAQHRSGNHLNGAGTSSAAPREKKSSKPPPSSTPPAETVSPKLSNTVIRPTFARNNTNVQIVDDVRPDDTESSQSHGSRTIAGGSSINDKAFAEVDEGLTLGDIPQLLESEQAREQHRSLPRQGTKPAVAELTPLELLIVKHFAVLALHRSPLRDQFDLDEILELVETKKSTFWNKIFKGNDKKNVKKKGGVFGVPLELLVERDGADSLLGASRATLRIPSFIDDVISAMKQMDMSIEGIFRKNGNIRRLKELTDAIDRDPASVDLTTDNPVQLAALLKRFLREMPDPLLTFKLHRLFILSQSFPSEAERLRFLHLVSLILPKTHRDTMEALFVFLKWVASFSHVDEETGSKMDLPNLATVICPSILYAKGRDVARDESFMAIRVVTLLLENQDEFFTVPDEFLSILNDQEYFVNCADLPGKDVLKKCEMYLRVKNGRPPPVPSNSGYAQNGNGASKGDGNEVRLVHQQRSDPMMRGRPMPPFAEGQPNQGKRSPRSSSRGPAGSSQSHSAHGHASSPNFHEAPPSAWAPGSPPTRNRPNLQTYATTPINTRVSTQADSGPPPLSPWDAPPRPESYYGRRSADQTRPQDFGSPPNSFNHDRSHSPVVQVQQRS